MSVGKDDLDSVVLARTVPGAEHARGRMIAYLPEPSVTIELESGTQLHWAARLCERLPDADAADFWRRKAECREIADNPDIPEFLKRGSGLTDFGRMNRALRLYFGLMLGDQADDLGLKSSELSGYETGRLDLPEGVKREVHSYWVERLI